MFPVMPHRKLFAAKLNAALAYRDLSQADLCRLTGFNHRRVSKWANGTGEPGPEELLKLARAMEIACEWWGDPNAGGADVGGAPAFAMRDDELYVLSTYRTLRDGRGLTQSEATIAMWEAVSGKAVKLSESDPAPKPEQDPKPIHEFDEETQRRLIEETSPDQSPLLGPGSAADEKGSGSRSRRSKKAGGQNPPTRP